MARHATAERCTSSVSTGCPVSSRWRHAATATTRHQSPADPSPSTTSRPSSTEARPAAQRDTSLGHLGRRPGARRARRGPVPTYVGRCVLRRPDQLLEPGDTGQHQQAVPAHRDRALDVGVEPVADHQRVAAADPGDGLLEQRPHRLAGHLRLAVAKRATSRDERPVARPDARVAVGKVMSVLLATQGSPVRTSTAPSHHPLPRHVRAVALRPRRRRRRPAR